MQKRLEAMQQEDDDQVVVDSLVAENAAELPVRPARPAKPALPLKAYAGVYRDPWYGTITLAETKGGLTIRFDKSPSMTGSLEPWNGEVFKTRFTDRNIEDAFVTFETTDGKVSRITLKAFSPSADFSYDYHDLEFRPA